MNYEPQIVIKKEVQKNYVNYLCRLNIFIFIS